MRVVTIAAPLALLSACAALIGIETTHDDTTATDDGGIEAGVEGGDDDVIAPAEIDAGETRDAEDESTLADLDGGDPGSDASPDAVAPPTCDLSKPFGTAKLISELDTSAWETGSHLSPDELTIWFQRRSSYASNDGDVYVATRADRQSAFGAPKKVTEINSPAADGAPSVRGDALFLFMGSLRSGSDGIDLYRSSRASASSAWSTPTKASTIDTSYYEDDPFLLEDGRALYWDSLRGGNGNIYRASVDATGNPGSAVSVSGINTSSKESEPVVTLDDLTIYFARKGSSKDIYVAKRATASAAWGAPVPVAELNTGSNENPDWISADGCHMAFSSDRGGGKGLYDLWYAEKP